MKFKQKLYLITALTSSLLCITQAQAHEYYAKSFKVIHPWALPSDPGETSAKVYVRFEEIAASDTLLGAQTSMAERVEIISAEKAVKESGAKRAGIALPSGTTIDLNENGAYLLLRNLRTPLQWQRSYPMTLFFEKSDPVEVSISIGAH